MTAADNYRPGDIVLSEDEIADIVARLGRRISEDYEGRNPILVNLLKGGVVFLADLIRRLQIPHHIDFLRVSSYDNGTTSSGMVRIIDDLKVNIKDRDVLVVEDVLDSGRTLAYILDVLKLRSPRSIEVCSLLRKQSVKDSRIDIKYLGKEIEDIWVVGYGLDYSERYRNLPHIAKLEIQE